MQIWVELCIWKAGLLQVAAGSNVQLLISWEWQSKGTERLPHFNLIKPNTFITNATACSKKECMRRNYSKLKHSIVYLIYILATTFYENVILLKTNYCIKPFNWPKCIFSIFYIEECGRIPLTVHKVWSLESQL